MRTWALRLSLLAYDRSHQFFETRIEKRQRGLIAHRILGKRRLLELRIDGVAVERGRHRHAVLEIGAERGIRCVDALTGEVRGTGARHCQRAIAAGAAVTACGGERGLEVDVARLVIR